MILDSPKNQRVRQWRELHTRRGREEARQFLAEGPHLVDEAIRAAAPISEIILRDDEPEPRGATGFRITRVTKRVMQAVCETETPQGVTAVINFTEKPPSPAKGKWLLLDAIQDPGNAGTMIRTAHAAGFSGVIFGEGSADPWNSKTLRASQGSIFHLPVATARLEEWIAALRGLKVTVYGTGAGQYSVDYRSMKPPADFALVMGNEGAGVRPELLAECDAILRIPMPGGAESLSVAVAAGILIFKLIES